MKKAKRDGRSPRGLRPRGRSPTRIRSYKCNFLTTFYFHTAVIITLDS